MGWVGGWLHGGRRARQRVWGGNGGVGTHARGLGGVMGRQCVCSGAMRGGARERQHYEGACSGGVGMRARGAGRRRGMWVGFEGGLA